MPTAPRNGRGVERVAARDASEVPDMENVAAGSEPVKVDRARALSDAAIARFWANVGKGNGKRGGLSGSPHPGGFWDRVDKTAGPDACWPWKLTRRTGGGYGSLHINGHAVGAHRRSYELTHGAIPKGLWVLHRCDNPPCCNPSHLFLGTNADNVADRQAKGRTRTKAGPRPEYRRKVTPEIAQEIRKLASDGVPTAALARRFKLSKQTIRRTKSKASEQRAAPAKKQPPVRSPRTNERAIDLAERLYPIVCAHPWSQLAELSAKMNVAVEQLQVPMRHLRGLDDRAKPSTRPVRVQTIGGRKWRRYAAVGVPLPASATKQEAHADG